MADDSNALTTITAERYARALEKVGAAGRPAEPPATEHASFAQRAELVLEQNRPPPPVEDDGVRDARTMLTEVNGRIDEIMQFAHSRRQASNELYTELAPELPELFAQKQRLEHSIKSQPEPGDADPHGQ